MGEDLSSLGPETPPTAIFEKDQSGTAENCSEKLEYERLCEHFFVGSGFSDLPGADAPRRDIGLKAGAPRSKQFPTMVELEAFLSRIPERHGRVDVVELFGGVGGVLKVLVRRGFKGGENFDLVCGWNLLNPEHFRAFIRYVEKYRPAIVIVAPPCTAFSVLLHCFGQLIKHLDKVKKSWPAPCRNSRGHSVQTDGRWKTLHL